MVDLKILVFVAIFGLANSAGFITAPNYFGQLYMSAEVPRSLFVDESGDLLYVSRSTASVLAVTEIIHPDGSIGLTEAELVNGVTYGVRINYGLTHHQGYLYAASDRGVYRWPYVAGSHDIGPHVPAETVITNIPSGGHATRPIAFPDAYSSVLYVNIGSDANVDPNSERARIRRFDLSNAVVFPIDFESGEVYADGLRNHVAMTFDHHGMLWGVENGADELDRPDLGPYPTIRNNNPAEELHRFDGPIGAHYGYPYCWSSDELEGYEQLTQFAWPSFIDDGTHTDEWCRNASNNRLPLLGLIAHSAPLGIEFYRGDGCENVEGAFPCDMIGDAFVALHGSGGRDDPSGYSVVRLPFTKSEPFLPTGEIEPIMYEPDTATCSPNCLRPVNAVFNKNGHLIVSADDSNEIFKLTYGVPPPDIKRQ